MPGPLRPRPTPGPTATPVPYVFAIDPPAGTCEETLLLAASNLPPGAAVAFVNTRRFEFEDTVLGEGVAGTDGRFAVSVPAAQMPYCYPGAEPLVQLRLDGRFVLGLVYHVQQLGHLTVEPWPIRCGEQMTIRGDGFPPGANVIFMQGADTPFVHQFVSLGEAVADASGRVVLIPDHWLCPQHNSREAVFAWIWNFPARWKAVIDYVP